MSLVSRSSMLPSHQVQRPYGGAVLAFRATTPLGAPEIETLLIQKGVTGKALDEDWGVKLWFLRANAQQKKITVTVLPTEASWEANRVIDDKGLALHLKNALGPLEGYEAVGVNVIKNRGAGCCGGRCPGCAIAPNAPNRKVWLNTGFLNMIKKLVKS